MGSVAEQLDYEIFEEVTDDVSIESASDRLAVAFDRLEAVISTRLLAAEGTVSRQFAEEQEALLGIWQEQCALLEREYEALKLENDRIAAQLNETQREFNDLREITQVVAGRLDGTINSIDKLLDA